MNLEKKKHKPLLYLTLLVYLTKTLETTVHYGIPIYHGALSVFPGSR